MKRFKKLLSLVLVFLMVFSSVAFSAEQIVADSKDLKPVDTTNTTLSNSLTDTNDKDKTSVELTNQLLPGVINDLKNKSNIEWLKRTDFQIDFLDNYKPEYTIETVQPLHQWQDKAYFWQGRLSHRSDDGTTGNLGIGYRKLSSDKQSLWGLNSFYDHAFKNDHSRWGVGMEYFWGDREFRANTYWGLSGDREIARTDRYITYERVVDGFDYELGTAFAKAPWLKVFASGYHWDYKYDDDVNGYKLRTSMQLTPRFNVELGYYHDNKDSQRYLNFTYNVLDSSTMPALWGSKINNAAFRASLEPKLLQKVVRENDIRIETYRKYLPATVVSTVFEQTPGGIVPLSGATVTVSPTITAPQIEQNVYTYRNVALGSYTFTASKDGYEAIPGESSKQVDVQGNTSVSLVLKKIAPITTTVTVRVFEQTANGNQPLTGASVADSPDCGTLNATGNTFTYSNVPYGSYTFTASKSGYEVVSGQSSQTVNVQGPMTVDLVLKKIAPITTTVTVRVFEQTADGNQPLTGASVADSPDCGTPNATGNTFTYSNVPYGSYTFTASKSGYEVVSGQSSQTVNVQGPMTVDLVLKKIAPITTTVTVRVFEQTADGNQPLTGASVADAPDCGTPNATSNTFTYSNVPYGSYTFTASKSGYEVVSGQSSQTVNVQGPMTVDLVLKKIAPITTTVTVRVFEQTADGNQPLTGASVADSPDCGTPNATGNTFTYSNVPYGSYTFTASKSGYEVVSGQSSQTVNVQGPMMVDLVLRAIPVYVKVNVKVAHTYGATVVALLNGTNAVSTDTTNSGGECPLMYQLPEGTYTFRVTYQGITKISKIHVVDANGNSNVSHPIHMDWNDRSDWN